MASTTAPLSQEDQARLESQLKVLPPDDFSVRLVQMFFRTGIHPKVLADPERYSLSIDGDVLTWRRTKNLQYIRFPIVPEIRDWLPEFIVDLETRSHGKYRGRAVNRALYYLRLVKQVGVSIGIPGLSCRGLRHTAIWKCMRKFHDVNEARRLFGVTAQIALNYAYTPANQAVDDRILREGL